MASIFKQSYTKTDPITGQKVKHLSTKYYIKYRAADGQMKRVAGARNLEATRKIAFDLEREAEMIRAGLLDATAKHARKSLADLLAEFKQSLESKKNTAGHVKLVEGRIKAILDACDFVYPRDLDASKVEKWLGDQHTAGAMALQTVTHYVRAIKQFTHWLDDHDRIMKDPMRLLKTMNAATDRRHVRRSLSAKEFKKLIASTKANRKIGTLTGPDRAILYLVAAYTGYRASELDDLTPESFDLDATPATVTCVAQSSKRRREDCIPLHKNVSDQVRGWLEGKQAGQPVWPGTWAATHHGGTMLKIDLKAAEIPYRDTSGRVFDFHALRGQFAANMARSGVHPRTAQLLMRHSNINLTMSFYSHLAMVDLQGAIDTLPTPPDATEENSSPENEQATGTEGG